MPSIKITEIDNTAIATNIAADNVAYIPGYAITGPINTPTLCDSIEQFQEIFGNNPYIIEENDGDYIKGEYEKSYLYAYDVLKYGLPIIYERIFNEANIKALTGKADINFTDSSSSKTLSLHISAKYPGRFIENFSVKLENTVKNSINYYKLSVIDTKSKKDQQVEQFIFDENSINNIDSKYIIVSAESFPDTYITGESIVQKLKVEENAPFEFSTATIYDHIKYFDGENTDFKSLDAKTEYDFKYWTSGAYPIFDNIDNNTAIGALKLATYRGDVTAIIDYKYDPTYNLIERYNQIKTFVDGIESFDDYSSIYGTMFTPYATYRISDYNVDVMMPPSFAYLIALGNSISTGNPDYLSIAGVSRGIIPNLLYLNEKINGAIADKLQFRDAVSINPLLNINPYGIRIWGNRTLKNNSIDEQLTAQSFLNIRNLVNDVKKIAYASAQLLTFEQNSDILWVNFKALIVPTLSQMKTNNAINGYKLIKRETKEKAKLVAVIKISPIEAIEDFDITIELTDSQINIE